VPATLLGHGRCSSEIRVAQRLDHYTGLSSIALYIAAGISAVWGFTRSNGEIDVTNGCDSTLYVELAGKIGFDGFRLGPGDTITIERPHTNEINAWRGTAVDNPNIRRIPIAGDAVSISIAGEACPT